MQPPQLCLRPLARSRFVGVIRCGGWITTGPDGARRCKGCGKAPSDHPSNHTQTVRPEGAKEKT